MTLTTKAKAALEASIKHWQENVAAETPKEVSCTSATCALCRAHPLCRACPVALRSGFAGCEGTPYEVAYFAHRNWQMAPEDASVKAAWRHAAQAELDFLISLRRIAQ